MSDEVPAWSWELYERYLLEEWPRALDPSERDEGEVGQHQTAEEPGRIGAKRPVIVGNLRGW